MYHQWLASLVVGLLSLGCAPADDIHPERGDMLERVKRSLTDLEGSENQVKGQ